MTTIASLDRSLGVQQTSGAVSSYEIAVTEDWSAIAAAWEEAVRTGGATPFQHRAWLDAWYVTLGREPGVTPLLVTVHDRAKHDWALRLPFIRRRIGGLTSVEFADLGLTDYNAPLLGPAAPPDRASATAIWRVLRRALKGIDLISLRKMPAEIAGRPNPLALLPGSTSCVLNGNIVHTGEDWDAYRHSLGKTVRKELERSWRVFTRHPQAAFRTIIDPAEARRVLAEMEKQQSERMRGAGVHYILDGPAETTFYRRLVDDGLRTGYAVLTALTVGDEVVACLLGIRDAKTYIMVRISNAGEAWSNCSPGRLIIERTMASLHAEGYRTFDFSIGNYTYKRRFGVEALPLSDHVEALTWRGVPPAAKAAASAWLRQRPALDAFIRRLMGKPVSRD